MSYLRQANDTTRIRKGLEYGSDSISPDSPVKYSSKGIFSDTRKETSEIRQQRHGRTTKKKGTAEGVGDGEARCITKHLSEITRTNDAVVQDDKKAEVGNETHGVLRVPESARTVSSSRKGPSIIEVENCAKNVVNDGTLIHEIATCETNLNNFVSRWSGDSVKFQHITTMWWVEAYCNNFV